MKQHCIATRPRNILVTPNTIQQQLDTRNSTHPRPDHGAAAASTAAPRMPLAAAHSSVALWVFMCRDAYNSGTATFGCGAGLGAPWARRLAW